VALSGYLKEAEVGKINSIIMVVATAILSSCVATPSFTKVTPCIEGNCIDGVGVLRDEQGTYTGEFSQGLPHGTGTYQYSDRRVYEGMFVAGRMEGEGVLTSGSTVYRGQFLDNRKHGQGAEVQGGQLRYEGAWANDKKHGEGTVHSSISIEGGSPIPMLIHTVFQDDKRVGPETVVAGSYRWDYEGTFMGFSNVRAYYQDREFFRGSASGYGVYTSPKGERIEGTWENAKLRIGSTDYWVLGGMVLASAPGPVDSPDPVDIEAVFIHPDGRTWQGSIFLVGDMNYEQVKERSDMPRWLFYYAPTGM
jgi:hypothetical protein